MFVRADRDMASYWSKRRKIMKNVDKHLTNIAKEEDEFYEISQSTPQPIHQRSPSRYVVIESLLCLCAQSFWFGILKRSVFTTRWKYANYTRLTVNNLTYTIVACGVSKKISSWFSYGQLSSLPLRTPPCHLAQKRVLRHQGVWSTTANC